MSQQDLADHCGGLKKASISAWELDKTKPTFDALLKLKKLFDMTLDELILGHSSLGLAPEFRGKVPLISWDNAGKETVDLREPDIAEMWIPCAEEHSERSYALIVEGHSMTSPVGRSYPEGRIIICDPDQCDKAASGQRVIARMAETGHLTFKELVLEDGRAWLRSLNPHSQYQPITGQFDLVALVIGSHIPE